MGGDWRSKLLEEAAWIGERLAEVPELTLGEIRRDLGSGLVDHSQKMMVAARLTAEKKAVGQRS